MRLRDLVTVAAVSALGVAGLPSEPVHAAINDPLVPVSDKSNFSVRWQPISSTWVDGLANDPAFPGLGPLSPGSLLSNTNHPMTLCNSSSDPYLPTAPIPNAALCWDSGDQDTEFWNPQGITSSGDADDDGMAGAYRALLSGWQVRAEASAERVNEARVAFVNYTDTARPSYRWAYLVTPTGGGGFVASKAHLGGMIWYGDKLIVSGTYGSRAFLVYDLSKIVRLNDSRAAIGKSGDKRFAYGYEYAIPQIGTYVLTTPPSSCDPPAPASPTAPLCVASISLDRSSSPDSLVLTEFYAERSGARLVRYPFGQDFLLRNDGGGVTSAWQAYATQAGSIQGVLSSYATNQWWTASWRAGNLRGWLYEHRTTGASGTPSCVKPDGQTNCWAVRPQALTNDLAHGVVWSQTEKWGERRVWSVRFADLPG